VPRDAARRRLAIDDEQVSEIMRFCCAHGIKVVPRGAGTSPSGGAIPQEDAIVLGVSKMNRILETALQNRVVRLQSGATNLAISQAVLPDGFFYAADPSSQDPVPARREGGAIEAAGPGRHDDATTSRP